MIMNRKVDLSTLTDMDLLRLYADVLDELQDRHVIHSTNNPVANYSELLACKTLGLTQMPESTKGYDALDTNGRRYEVKGRRPTAKNKSRQLSFIRELDKQHFEYLVGVLYNEDFTVKKACIIPYAVVKQLAKYHPHPNAWTVMLEDQVWRIDGVEDITLKMAETQIRLQIHLSDSSIE
jgi:hypothetical protein